MIYGRVAKMFEILLRVGKTRDGQIPVTVKISKERDGRIRDGSVRDT